MFATSNLSPRHVLFRSETMRSPTLSVSFVTAYLLVYAAIAIFGNNAGLALALFIFSPILVLWMVYTVLKYGKPSGRTFDEYFYDDVDLERIPDKD